MLIPRRQVHKSQTPSGLLIALLQRSKGNDCQVIGDMQMLAIDDHFVCIGLRLEKVLEIRGRREEQRAMQDIGPRTFIAVFHVGAYFARMQPSEVQCGADIERRARQQARR